MDVMKITSIVVGTAKRIDRNGVADQRDAIDRDALRFDFGGTSWTPFCGEQSQLLSDTLPPLPLLHMHGTLYSLHGL